MVWYVLKDKKPVKAKSMEEAARALEKDRRVAYDKLPGDVEVSTVFLVLDLQFGNGPPLLFETLVFGGEHNEEMRRYSTWEEAEEGHKEMVKMIRKEELKVVNGGKND